MKCNHDNTQFMGTFSMSGSYYCKACGFAVDPVIEHLRKKESHVLFREENKEKLQAYLNKLPKEQLALLENL